MYVILARNSIPNLMRSSPDCLVQPFQIHSGSSTLHHLKINVLCHPVESDFKRR